MTAFQINHTTLPIKLAAPNDRSYLPRGENPFQMTDPCQLKYRPEDRPHLRSRNSDQTLIGILDLKSGKLLYKSSEEEGKQHMAEPERFRLALMQLMKWQDGKTVLVVHLSSAAEKEPSNDLLSNTALEIYDIGSGDKVAGPFPMDYGDLQHNPSKQVCRWNKSFLVAGLPHDRLNFVFRKIL